MKLIVKECCDVSRTAVTIISACGLLIARGSASAQSRDTVAPIVLPGLDVSVTRSLAPVSRLPFAITSSQFPPGTLSSAIAADGALRGIPGVQVSNRFNDAVGERITIRGMGARAQFGIRGIRVLVDGIPATMPDGQTTLTHLDASAVTSTEVLRGPASSLWGNASGGVIELRTSPLSSRFGDASVTAGANGLTRGSLSGAFAPSSSSELHARITRQQYNGFRANSESRKTLASAGGNWQHGADRAWISAHAVDYNAKNPGSLSQRQLDSARLQANPNNVRQKTGENGRHGEVGAGWQHRIGEGTLEVSGYALHRTLTSPIPPTIIELRRNAGGARAVVNLSPLSALLLTTGVEAGLQSDDRVNHVNTLGARAALTLDQAERVTYAAPFAQVLLAITHAVDGLAAIRYDHYQFRVRDRFINAQNSDDPGTRTMNAPSVTFGARAHAGAASIYSNYATSFQTPTTTELANRPDGARGFNPLLNPERTHSAEVGGTMTFAVLRIDAAAYDAHVRDALIPFEVPAAAGRQFFRNAGSIRNRGVEVSAALHVLRALDITSSVARIDSRFDRYTVGTATYDGQRVPGVARTTADASAQWSFTRDANVLVSARRSGSTSANDANTASTPAYHLFDAAVQAAPLRLRGFAVRLSGGVTNISDVAYNTAVSINAAGSRYFEPGPGRAIYVSGSLGTPMR